MERSETVLSQVVNEQSCVTCGACCAYFRVSFYWAEGEQMPQDMIEPLTAVYSCMQGTNQKNPRCVALDGELGKAVSCSIYEARSSSCKEVMPADTQCNKARAAHGFIPLIEISEPATNDEDFDQVS